MEGVSRMGRFPTTSQAENSRGELERMPKEINFRLKKGLHGDQNHITKSTIGMTVNS